MANGPSFAPRSRVPRAPEAALSLPETLLAPLAERVAAEAGLRVGQRWLLEARVEALHRANGAGEPLARFVERVLEDADLLEALVEALRVGETRFWRHPRQLRAIRRVALPELAAACEAEGRPLRIWSAGCASGEEAYTLVMLVRQARPELAVEVLATDLSEEALAAARAARYDAERVRDVPPSVARWALAEEADGRFSVAPEVRAAVRFERRNLLGDPYPDGRDLVLCRNVLIYFDPPTRQRVLEQLFRSARLHGWVALGYADRVPGEVAGVEPVRTDEGVLYRRVTERPSVLPPPPAPSPARPTPRAPTTSAAAPSSTPPVRPRPALVGSLEGEPGRRRAHEVLAALLESGGRELDLTRLRFADEGVGRELRRVAVALADGGEALTLYVETEAVERFLRRHRVTPPARLRRGGSA